MTESEPEALPLHKADYEALAAFRRRLRQFLHLTEEGARHAGLTPQQHQVLLTIKGQPGRDWISIAEAAEALSITHHAAVGLADRCERSGLLERSRDPEDRRQVRLGLTPAGEAALAEVTRFNKHELLGLQQALTLPFLKTRA